MGLPAEHAASYWERERVEILAFLHSLLSPKIFIEAEAVDFDLSEAIWFRLSPGLLRAIDLTAEIEGRTRSAMLRVLLDEAIAERKLRKASGG